MGFGGRREGGKIKRESKNRKTLYFPQTIFVRHGAFIFITHIRTRSIFRNFFLCGTAHSCVTWLIHKWDMIHAFITHICKTFYYFKPHFVWHAWFICMTWCIHMCDTTHSFIAHIRKTSYFPHPLAPFCFQIDPRPTYIRGKQYGGFVCSVYVRMCVCVYVCTCVRVYSCTCVRVCV